MVTEELDNRSGNSKTFYSKAKGKEKMGSQEMMLEQENRRLGREIEEIKRQRIDLQGKVKMEEEEHKAREKKYNDVKEELETAVQISQDKIAKEDYEAIVKEKQECNKKFAELEEVLQDYKEWGIGLRDDCIALEEHYLYERKIKFKVYNEFKQFYGMYEKLVQKIVDGQKKAEEMAQKAKGLWKEVTTTAQDDSPMLQFLEEAYGQYHLIKGCISSNVIPRPRV